MIEFAHRFANEEDAYKASVISQEAAYTLILHNADGSIHIVDSNDMPALKNKHVAIGEAMFSVRDKKDSCDVLWFGEFIGTAEYVNMTPDRWFSNMQVVFSEFVY